VEKAALYFRFLILYLGLSLSFLSLAQAVDINNPIGLTFRINRDFDHQHLLVYNIDGSVRGGAYALYPFTPVYVTSLHTLQNSWFFEIYKSKFTFYGFQLPRDQDTNGRDKVFKWVDMVFIVSKEQYPGGLKDPSVRSLINSLVGRDLGTDVGSALSLVESIVPVEGNLSRYQFKTNQGEIQKTMRGLMFEISHNRSTITPGSSGALVYAQSTAAPGATVGFSNTFTDKIPIGILKCRDLKFPQREGVDRYELQSFDFLSDFDLWITELKSIPDVKYDPLCININGRGHGGL
jgi:hypothetical protein